MRFNYLDVLKAIAIIAVILYHSGFMPLGYLGVDIFLVINGYLITKSLSKAFMEDNKRAIPGYFSFVISRIDRLLPVLLVAGIVCMAVGFFVMLPDDYENLSESVIATNLFGNNILAAITTKNYWDVVNEYKPLMHTWYVGVVMQFYLLYPILFLFARFDNKNPSRTLLTMVSVLAFVSLCIYFGISNYTARFYYLPSRLFEFAAGGIVALSWKPNLENIFHSSFIYGCYALLLSLMIVNVDLIPADIRLLLVVALTVVLLMSYRTLENRVTGNQIIAKIGATSYSIFVWHQVLLAFYRYTISSHFTVLSYTLFLIAVSVFSWLTYEFIEQKTSGWLKEKKSKTFFHIITLLVFLCLTAFAGFIYYKGGVVRDVPELYITRGGKADHKAYNDKIYKLDKPFESEKRHWLVVGNSFGRDLANTILESDVSDSVEVSYINYDSFKDKKYSDRFANADKIFLSLLGTTESIVSEFETVCLANSFDVRNVVIVGTKNFGESNGQFYIKRNKPDYFEQRTKMEEGYAQINSRLKAVYGERYLDLINLVIDDDGLMPVFTPDHHFVSQDCRHFSKGGAIWFGQLIDWGKYLK